MIGAKHILANLEEELAFLEIHQELCVRRPSLAQAVLDCSACVDTCPHDALRLDPLTMDEDACDGCGACVEVCPTPALEHASSFRRDLFTVLTRVKHENVFRVACPLALDSDVREVWKVPCIAGMPWEAPVAALLRGAPSVEVATGPCAQCTRHQVENLVNAAIDASSRACAALGMPALVRSAPLEPAEEEWNPDHDRRVSRRGLFDGMLSRGKKLVERAGAKGVERLSQVVTPDAGTQETVDVLWLRSLLAHATRGMDAVETATLPRAAHVVLDTDKCTPCPLCATACPGGALHVKLDLKGTHELSIEPERCTGCGACVVACPQAAITLDPAARLATWGRRRSLIARAPDACRHCGEPALSTELPYCARCYREGYAIVR